MTTNHELGEEGLPEFCAVTYLFDFLFDGDDVKREIKNWLDREIQQFINVSEASGEALVCSLNSQQLICARRLKNKYDFEVMGRPWKGKNNRYVFMMRRLPSKKRGDTFSTTLKGMKSGE